MGSRLADFDWCDFCEHDGDYTIEGYITCDSCNQQYGKEPSNFCEKTSVTAYRRKINDRRKETT